jgi:hypothetical protein
MGAFKNFFGYDPKKFILSILICCYLSLNSMFLLVARPNVIFFPLRSGFVSDMMVNIMFPIYDLISGPYHSLYVLLGSGEDPTGNMIRHGVDTLITLTCFTIISIIISNILLWIYNRIIKAKSKNTPEQ